MRHLSLLSWFPWKKNEWHWLGLLDKRYFRTLLIHWCIVLLSPWRVLTLIFFSIFYVPIRQWHIRSSFLDSSEKNQCHWALYIDNGYEWIIVPWRNQSCLIRYRCIKQGCQDLLDLNPMYFTINYPKILGIIIACWVRF